MFTQIQQGRLQAKKRPNKHRDRGHEGPPPPPREFPPKAVPTSSHVTKLCVHSQVQCSSEK